MVYAHEVADPGPGSGPGLDTDDTKDRMLVGQKGSGDEEARGDVRVPV